MADVQSSSYGHVVWGRHLLADNPVTNASVSESTVARRRSETVWFVNLVVGNHVVFAVCVIVLIVYVAAVVTRIVLHAVLGPVRI